MDKKEKIPYFKPPKGGSEWGLWDDKRKEAVEKMYNDIVDKANKEGISLDEAARKEGFVLLYNKEGEGVEFGLFASASRLLVAAPHGSTSLVYGNSIDLVSQQMNSKPQVASQTSWSPVRRYLTQASP